MQVQWRQWLAVCAEGTATKRRVSIFQPMIQRQNAEPAPKLYTNEQYQQLRARARAPHERTL
jgi:hypothetical protein